MQQISVVWFRNDLRLDDNPALNAAVRYGLPILPLFIYPDGQREPGAASEWWLDKSLRALSDSIQKRGGRLHVVAANGRPVHDAFECLLTVFDVKSVFWNRRYEPFARNTDEHAKTWLREHQIAATSFNGNLLCEPWDLKTQMGDHYKVFTPFWRALKQLYSEKPSELSDDVRFLDYTGTSIDELGLHPSAPDWSGGISKAWQPGETAARQVCQDFLDNRLKGYHTNRDRPDRNGTSRLSPYLAFGEISPRRIWEMTASAMAADDSLEEDGWAFLRELAWRDFAYSLLFQSPDLSEHNWNRRFDQFDWAVGEDHFIAWTKGQTGYPIVDAGMRQLWTTGWMHNRVRMIVASFLVKHLRIDWRHGEKWFWDTLVDADVANNPASWQWVAGSGADAAPYFRIFNPITQAEKFDPDGSYIKTWIPELKQLPVKFLSAPWTASPDVLRHAGVKLGLTYPKPVVEHKTAREAALRAYELTK